MTVKREAETPAASGEMRSSTKDSKIKSVYPTGNQQADTKSKETQDLVIANKNAVEKQQNYGRYKNFCFARMIAFALSFRARYLSTYNLADVCFGIYKSNRGFCSLN